MTTVSAPRTPPPQADDDPVVEVSLVSGPPVASLALSLLAATRAAALACLPWVGRDEPKAADGAAVAAMRDSLAQLPGRATVVIGEGEKDDAPMLFAGEELGTGDGPACELAVDPLEGTRLCARGQEGAVAVLAAGPPGSLWDTPGWYMEKLVVPAAAAGAVSLDRPLDENLSALAAALDKPVSALLVAIQDRPRHTELVAAVRRLGAGVVLFGDGDVMTSLRVLCPRATSTPCWGSAERQRASSPPARRACSAEACRAGWPRRARRSEPAWRPPGSPSATSSRSPIWWATTTVSSWPPG